MSADAQVAGQAPAHVLCWVDGTEEACRAAAWAARIADRFDAKLTYLALGRHLSRSEGLEDFARIENVELSSTLDTDADVRTCLAQAVSIARQIGHTDVNEFVTEGTPQDSICSAARHQDVDLVVLGRHRVSFAERLLGRGIGQGCGFSVLSVP